MKGKVLVVLTAVASMVAGVAIVADANYINGYESKTCEFNGYVMDTSSKYNERWCATNEGKERYFYLVGTRLSLGPYWYISIREVTYETILNELEGASRHNGNYNRLHT